MNSISTQEVGDNVQTRQTGKNKKKHTETERRRKKQIYMHAYIVFPETNSVIATEQTVLKQMRVGCVFQRAIPSECDENAKIIENMTLVMEANI